MGNEIEYYRNFLPEIKKHNDLYNKLREKGYFSLAEVYYRNYSTITKTVCDTTNVISHLYIQ